jgi:hypothetical protein
MPIVVGDTQFQYTGMASSAVCGNARGVWAADVGRGRSQWHTRAAASRHSRSSRAPPYLVRLDLRLQLHVVDLRADGAAVHGQ